MHQVRRRLPCNLYSAVVETNCHDQVAVNINHISKWLMMTEPLKQPFCIRLAWITATAWILGLLSGSTGAWFTDPKLKDLMPAIGTSVTTVCSLLFLLIGVLIIADCIRTKTFDGRYLLAVTIAVIITLVAGPIVLTLVNENERGVPVFVGSMVLSSPLLGLLTFRDEGSKKTCV